MLYVRPLETAPLAGKERLGDLSVRTRAAAQELEHYFLFLLLQAMRKTIVVAGQAGSSLDQQFYGELLDDALSAEMTRSGQIGLARLIEAQIAANSEPGTPNENEAIREDSGSRRALAPPIR